MDKHKRLLIILFMTFSVFGCFSKRDDTWTTFSLGIPEEIAPSRAHSISVNYVLKQTHEPFLRKESNGDYSSKLFQSWDRDINNKEFNFCLNDGLKFPSGRVYGVKNLKADFERIIDRKFKNKPVSLTERQSCVKVSFGQPNENFLEVLTFYENAPTEKSQTPKVEDGFGAYVLSLKSDKKMVLNRKKKSEGKFNKIEFININNSRSYLKNYELIEDYNFIPENEIPVWAKENYQKISRTPLKTGILLLNIKDKAVRSAIFNCVNIKRLRQGLFPSIEEFVDIKSILPIGISGGESGSQDQKCTKRKFDKQRLTLYSWENIDLHSLNEELSDLKRKTGIDVVIKKRPYNDLNTVLYSGDFDLIVIGATTKNQEYAPFFDTLAGKKTTVFKYIPSYVHKRFEKLVSAESREQQKSIALDLQKMLIDNHHVLPLFLFKRTFYYPKNIKGLDFGYDYLDFPEVDKLEI